MQRIGMLAAAALVAGLVQVPSTAAPAAAAREIKGSFGAPLAVTTWPVPTGGAGLVAATQGPGHGQGGIVSWNGALWFAEEESGSLGRVDTAGNITEYALPTQVSNPGYGPRQLSAASSAGLWFAADWAALEGRAARINQQGNIDGYFSGGTYVRLASVTATPDGGAWVTYRDGEGVSRLAPDGTQTQFFAQPRYGADAESTLGSDGALWFSDGTSVIQRITDSGSLSNFAATGDEGEIVSLATSGGSVWYAKFNPGTYTTPSRSGLVGKMSTSGVAKPFRSPYPDLIPAALTPAADGGVWFTTHHGRGVGHVDPAGAYRVARMPEGHRADSVAVGPDGNLWYTDRNLNQVGRITKASFDASTASQGNQLSRARVAARKGKVAKNRASVALKCVKGGPKCRGKVVITKRQQVVAKGRFAVKTGKKKIVRVKLTKAGRKFFRTHRKAKLTVLLSGKTGSSKRAVVFRRKG